MEILSVKHITKSFGDNKIIEDISLTLKKGELVSLLGVSGAGKTTLFNCISGIDKAEVNPFAAYSLSDRVLH